MLEIISNYHWRETDYAIPEWGDAEEECFTYRGELYFLSEFMRTSFPNAPAWIMDWQGYHGDSFFSGILVRFGGYDENPDHYGDIQVATYIS